MDATFSSRARTGVALAVGALAVFACVPWAALVGSPWPWLLFAGIAVWSAMSPAAERAGQSLERLNRLAPGQHRALTAGVFLASFAILLLTAWLQSRSFVPTWHDHHMYLIQAQMAATGRLTMPQHAMADFFETFHVFTHGVYASMYFPGAGLMHAPAVWLHAPYSLFPLLIAAGIVTLVFQIVGKIQDVLSALLAAGGMLAVSQFRFLSIDVMSHTVALLLVLGMVRAWLEWRGTCDGRWAGAIGGCAGWAAITRPVDALSFALPLGAAMAWELRRQAGSRWLVTAGALVAAAFPFLAVQATFNYQVTGSVFSTPTAHYYRTAWGYEAFREGKVAEPVAMTQISRLPQKQLFYECFVKPTSVQRSLAARLTTELPGRIGALLAQGAPGGWALVLLPLGCLALGDIRKVVLVTPPLFFMAGYLLLVPQMLDHYYVLAAPSVIALVVFGRQRLAEALPRPRAAAVGLALGLVVSAVAWFPGFRDVHDENIQGYRLMRYVHETLPEKVREPAVVLFRFHASQGNSFHTEPVYNTDAAWPDDAPIVKAHDLGAERDIEIAEYYARLQPERRFYLFDRNDDVNCRVKDLGTAGEFAAKLRALVRQQKQAAPPEVGSRGHEGLK